MTKTTKKTTKHNKAPKLKGVSINALASLKKKHSKGGQRKQSSAARQGSSAVKSVQKKFVQMEMAEQKTANSDMFNSLVARHGEEHETLQVVISSFALSQYVTGFLSSLLINSDRLYDQNNLPRMAMWYISQMQNIESSPVPVWPRKLLEVALALRNRRVGRFEYAPDWTAINSWLTAVQGGTYGWSPVTCGFALPTFSGTISNGFATSTTLSVTLPSTSEVFLFHTNFSDQLDLYPVGDSSKIDNRNDASAFAWDIAPPRIITLSTNNNASADFEMTYCVGCHVNTVSPFQILTSTVSNISSTVGLETPIKRPHLAKIRLGTQMPFNDWYTPPPVPVNRQAQFVQVVKSAPGTLGFSSALKNCGPDPQVKLVPASDAVAGIQARFEYIGALIGAKWLSAFGNASGNVSDIKYLSYLLYRRLHRRFAGASIGVLPSQGTTGTIIQSDSPVHINDAIIDSMKVPEPIMNFIGAQSAYFDNRGTIFPFCAIPTLSGQSSLSYTGTNTYTGYPGAGDANLNNGTLNYNLVLKYKALEPLISQYCNMKLATKFGGSLLDCTFLTDSGVVGMMGLVSRRPVDDFIRSKCMSCADVVSYAAVSQSTTNPLSLTSNYIKAFSHLYDQGNQLMFSGYDPWSSISALTVYDGFVTPGTLASNVDGNMGPDMSTAYPALNPIPPPMPRGYTGPAPGSNKNLLTVVRDYISPSWGKYCGPDYSAGRRGSGQRMENGEFMVPPDSKEDALCKAHDENYVRANGDSDLINLADKEFVSGLRKLLKDNELSLRGKAALTYFDKQNYKDEL